jgi:hypothetical protein
MIPLRIAIKILKVVNWISHAIPTSNKITNTKYPNEGSISNYEPTDQAFNIFNSIDIDADREIFRAIFIGGPRGCSETIEFKPSNTVTLSFLELTLLSSSS